MEMTFAEFAQECELYHRSKESYDCLRESFEITMMEKYIEDQKFYEAHAGEFANSVLANGFFSESVDVGSLEVLTEKAKGKKFNLMHQIMKGLLKIVHGFWKFTGKMSSAFDKTTADAENVVKALNSQVLSDAKMERVRNLVVETRQSCPGFIPHEDQPFASKLKVTPVTGQVDDYTLIGLAAGLSNTKAKAKVGLANGAAVGALPIDTLRKAAVEIYSGNIHTLPGTIQGVMSTWTTTSMNGLEIPVIPKEIDRASAQLKQVCDSIEAALTGMGGTVSAIAGVTKTLNTIVANDKTDQQANNAGDQNGQQNSGPDVHDKINQVADVLTGETAKYVEQLRGYISNSIGASMRLYSDYSKYRKMMISGMKTILTDKEPDSVTQPTAQPAAS